MVFWNTKLNIYSNKLLIKPMTFIIKSLSSQYIFHWILLYTLKNAGVLLKLPFNSD